MLMVDLVDHHHLSGGDAIDQLTALGFSRKSAKNALEASDGKAERALKLLQDRQTSLAAMSKEELDEKVESVMKEIDTYHTGEISFRQLLSWVRRQQGGKRVTDEMLTRAMEVFNKYDKEADGYLERHDIQQILLEMESDEMFSSIITNFLADAELEEVRARSLVKGGGGCAGCCCHRGTLLVRCPWP